MENPLRAMADSPKLDGYFRVRSGEEGFYKALGVDVFIDKVLRNKQYRQWREKYFRGDDPGIQFGGLPPGETVEEQLQGFDSRTRKTELGHVLGAAAQIGAGVALGREFEVPRWAHAANLGVVVLLHAYPIMAQRYNRGRIQRLLPRLQTRNEYRQPINGHSPKSAETIPLADFPEHIPQTESDEAV